MINAKSILKTALIMLAATAIPLVLFLSKRKADKFPVNVIRDTNLVRRYEAERRRDTVYRITDRIIYRKAEPDVVYIQRTDTVFISKILSDDLPLRVQKNRDELSVKAVNIKDSTLKEYIFRDISRDFTLYTTRSGINVKSKNFSLEYPELSLRTVYLTAKRNLYYEISAGSGISFREKISLSAGCGYETLHKNLIVSLSLKLKGL